MSRGKSHERHLLVATVVLALFAAVQLGVVRPTVRTIRRLNTKAAYSACTLERMRATAGRAADVEAAYEQIRTRISSAKSSQREIIDMLAAIQQAADEAGVLILENVHNGDSPSEYFSRHIVRFRGQGTIEQMMAMLYALQDSDLLLRIPEMTATMKDYKLEMELDITRVVSISVGDE